MFRYCSACRITAAVYLAYAVSGATVAHAAALLRTADIHIVVTSPTTCDVSMRLSIEGATEVEHRIEAFEGSRTELISITNASRVGEVTTKGRTRSLVVRPGPLPYEIHYTAEQTAGRRGRCPLWLPTVPTDGRSRAVELHVELPASTVPARSMPAFNWSRTSGSTTLAHVPAFVRVPYLRDGESPGWDMPAVIDALTLAIFAAASAVWVWHRRRAVWG